MTVAGIGLSVYRQWFRVGKTFRFWAWASCLRVCCSVYGIDETDGSRYFVKIDGLECSCRFLKRCHGLVPGLMQELLRGGSGFPVAFFLLLDGFGFIMI